MASSITVASPLGRLTLVARAGRLLALRFTDRGVLAVRRRTPELDAVAEQLDQYFQGGREEFDLPLRPPEDRFDWRVLEAAARIPYGERTTYGALASELGLAADRARDVGAALGRNPVPILIPCHRVVGADGRLTGYGGGLERKAALLELEAPQLQLTA